VSAHSHAAPSSQATQPTILIVCTANACCSPAALFLLRRRLGPCADAFRIESAGTAAVQRAPMDPVVGELLQRADVEFTPFAARTLTPGMLASADLVLTATTGQRAAVVRLLPSAVRRTLTLKQLARYAPAILDSGPPPPSDGSRIAWILGAVPGARQGSAGRGDDSVPDPTGGSRRRYIAAFEELDRACTAIAPLFTVEHRPVPARLDAGPDTVTGRAREEDAPATTG
jgi:protein-tyrosine phosphatase